MIRLKRKIIIAIDGYSSCGKSSFAKLIARELAYLYLDSGAMYRAVAYFAIRNGFINDKRFDEKNLILALANLRIRFIYDGGDNTTLLNGEDIERQIRGPEVSAYVSTVSKIPAIRRHMVVLQQEMGKEKGIVMDGRDIGTVVFPDAEIKIFMQADPEIRAKRRYDELMEKGIEASLDSIRQNIKNRDYQDTHRKLSPLRQAEDALILDNSTMTFAEQMSWFQSVLLDKGLLNV